MKRKLTSILLMSALLVGGASTFVSCKDYDGDQAAVTNANVKGLSDKLQEQIAALEAAKIELAKKADKVYVDDAITRIDGTIATLQTTLDAVKASTEQNASDIAQNAADIADLVQKVAAANDEIVAVKADITAINTKLTELGNKIDTKADKQDLDNLISKLETTFGPNFENALLKGHLAEYAAGEGAADFTAAMLTSLNNAIAAANVEQFGNVTELFEYLDKTLPDTISALASKCAYLAGQDSLLNDRIDSLVTSVNVDMVSNPIYGTFNTPFGIKNYVVAGFVGGQIENVDFNGVKVGGLAASADGGNIYLTVNPAEVDAEGWSLNLVGRDGKPAPGFGNLVLVADNTPVTTLSTRASNGLGGYVAAAKIEDAAAAKVVIDKEGLKDVAKNVLGKLRGEEALDITNAVRTIYNQFNNIIPQYYAIKCQVKDDKSYGDTKTKTYVSDYNIAAVTVKPLAFTTNIGAVGAKVNIPSIPSFEELLGIEINDITISPVTSEIDNFTFTVVDGSWNYWNAVKVEYNADGTGTIDMPLYSYDQRQIIPFTSCVAEDVFDEYNNKIAVKYTVNIAQDANEIVSELNANLASIQLQVNTTLGSVRDAIKKAGNAFDKVAPKLNKVISKVNYFLDNANQYLQPIMLAVADGDAFRLSEVASAPSVVKANGENAIILAPTSYTLELLAPAYKKSVKVNDTELNGEDLDGATKTIAATLKAGKNTIEYSVMDFYGNVVDKKYYIEVK